MKHTKSFVSTIFFSLILAACSLTNSVEPPKQIPNTPSPEGKILVVAGVDSMSAARSAIPSGIEDAKNFAYAAALYTSSFADSDLVVGSYDDSAKTVSFEFAKPASTTDLTLEIFAFQKPAAGETLTPSTTNALLSAKQTTLTVENNTINVGDLKLLPYKPTGATGNVELSVTVPDGHSLEIRNTTDSTTFSCNQSGTTATISASDIPAKAYTLVFLVSKSGATVYAWTENINVFNGMTTNAWMQASGTLSTAAKTISDDTINTAALTTFYVLGASGTWYTSVLGATAPDAGNDDNSGSLMKPLATVQAAINKVKAANATAAAGTQYTIYVDGEFTADWSDADTPVANIAAGSNTLKLSIIGLGTDSQKATFDGNKKIYNVVKGSGANLVLNLENLKITGGDGDINWQAKKGGGVLAQDGIYTLKNCEIIANKARSGGGVALLGKSLTLSGCVVNKNSANYGGGISIYSYGSKDDTTSPYPVLTLKDNTIIGNGNLSSFPTTSDDYGNTTTDHSAGILAATNNDKSLKPAKIIIESGCYVIGNHSTNKAGGIFLENTGTLEINEGAFIKYNHAPNGDGGGILISSTSGYPASIVTISGSVIGNKASDNGGGIAMTGGTMTLNSGAKIQDNTAQYGGGLYIYETGGTATRATMTSCVISGNSATKTLSYDSGTASDGGKGGGIYIGGNYSSTTDGNFGINPDVTMKNVTIESNTSNFYGGGIMNFGKLTLEGCTLGGESASSANSALTGGGMYTNGTVTIKKDTDTNKNTFISKNTCTNAGGGISNGANGILSISGAEIKENVAPENSGAAIQNFGKLNFSNYVKIEDNDVLLCQVGNTNAVYAITIESSFDSSLSKIATITPGKPGVYSNDVQVLKAASGVTLATEAPKFAVTPDSAGKVWKVNSTGNLEEVAQIPELTVAEACDILTTDEGEITLYVKVMSEDELFGLANYITSYNNYGTLNLILTESSTILEIGENDSNEAAFKDCTCLISLTIPSSVKSISAGQFTTCTSLSNVTFANTSGWYYNNGSGITTITASDLSDSGNNATKLKTGGDWNGKELKYSNLSTAEIDDATGDDTIYPSVTLETLTDLEILKNSVLAATTRGANVNLTLTATVKSQAELETLANYIDNTVMTSASNLSKLFIDLIITDDSTIEKIGENTPPAGTSAKGVFDQRTHLKSIKLPVGLKEITDAAFYMCENLETVTLPPTMKNIGKEAFISCVALSSINLPEGISTIGQSAFDGCEKLKNVTLPSTLITIGDYAFCDTSLISISIPSNVGYIGTSAFKDCEDLASVSFEKTSDWYYSSSSGSIKITDLSDTGANATKLKSDSGEWGNCYLFNKFDVDSATEILNKATSGNIILTVEVTPSNLSTLVDSLKKTNADTVDLVLTGTTENKITTIETDTFRYAGKLRSIVLPETVTKISDYSFSQCENLESVFIPNSVTEIAKGAFSYCYKLEKVTIPNSVKLIGSQVFESCTALESITIENPSNKTWYYTDSYMYAFYKQNGIELDLSNPQTNVTYFKTTYLDKYWYRED